MIASSVFGESKLRDLIVHSKWVLPESHKDARSCMEMGNEYQVFLFQEGDLKIGPDNLAPSLKINILIMSGYVT